MSSVPTLYVLHAAGCEACAMLKPELRRFWEANRGRVRIVPVDLTRAEWQARKWEPQETPTLVVRYPDGRLSEKLVGYGPGRFKEWVGRVLG